MLLQQPHLSVIPTNVKTTGPGPHSPNAGNKDRSAIGFAQSNALQPIP